MKKIHWKYINVGHKRRCHEQSFFDGIVQTDEFRFGASTSRDLSGVFPVEYGAKLFNFDQWYFGQL